MKDRAIILGVPGPKRTATMFLSIRFFLLLCMILLAFGQETPILPTASKQPDVLSPVIVIGFVGGFVRPDDSVHSPVQLAARLCQDYPAGVYVEAFENRRREKAHAVILRLLDANHDGKLSAEEKQSARIIIYGMSWGASESVMLARELQTEGIPVLLTIQVDSVSKIRPEIRAADAARTRILGNFRFDYSTHPISCAKYTWYDRLFAKPHTEIECDPTVWKQVESLIRSKLRTPLPNGADQVPTQ